MTQTNPILRAAAFAKAAHTGQMRKYNDEDYILHPARVAARVALLEGATETMVVAAFLHDVLEDTDVDSDEILEAFGPEVLALVQELTNPSKGSDAPRDARKQMDRDHLKEVSQEAKRIKLVDRYENLLDAGTAPGEFSTLYAAESRLLLEAVGDADPILRAAVEARIEELEGAK